MAHTLNEHSLVITGADADERYANLLTGIETLTGWSVDGDVVYIESSEKLTITFTHSTGATTCKVQFMNLSTEVMSTSSFSLSSDFTIYFHRSSDDNVEFLDLNQTYCQIVHAINSNNEHFIMSSESNDMCYMASTAQTGKTALYCKVTEATTYCITALPDIINGATIPSLYLTIGTANPVRRNQLVSFNGSTYRIAFFGSSTSTTVCPAIAFPVAESA